MGVNVYSLLEKWAEDRTLEKGQIVRGERKAWWIGANWRKGLKESYSILKSFHE